MPLSKNARTRIYELFLDCSVRALERVEQRIENETKPFHEALIPTEVLIPAAFERSWSSSFGRKSAEGMARIVVEDFNGEAEGQHTETMNIDTGILQGIERYREQARSQGLRLGWEDTIRYIDEKSTRTGRQDTISVTSDLYFRRDGSESFFSLKTVKPNIDQTMEAKLDLLRLHYGRRDDSDCLGFALWYNPYGDGRPYAWSPPFSVFSMSSDSVVYIGSRFWNKLGDRYTYDELLEIAASVGTTSVAMIQDMMTELMDKKHEEE